MVGQHHRAPGQGLSHGERGVGAAVGSGVGSAVGSTCRISSGGQLWDLLVESVAGPAVGSAVGSPCRSQHLCPPAAVLPGAFPVPILCSLQTSSKDKEGITGLSVKSPCLGCSDTVGEPPWLFPPVTVWRVWLFLMFSGNFVFIKKKLMWTRTGGSIVSNEQKVL